VRSCASFVTRFVEPAVIPRVTGLEPEVENRVAETPTKRKRLKSRAVRVRSVANATTKASAVMPPHVRHPGELVKVSHQHVDECMDRLPRTSTQLQDSTLGVACFRARSKPRR
jgi:hypothetical protein